MLSKYRAWLVSELAILGNASHHAYALGQANMAKRAIEELDAELAKGPSKAQIAEARAALASLEERDGSVPPALATLLAML